MHELSIAQDLLGVVEKALGGKKELDTVNLVLGPLSGVSPEALTFCFTETACERGFGRPELKISNIPARIKCTDCSFEYEVNDFYQGCPECSSFNREILSGRECYIDSVELIEDD